MHEGAPVYSWVRRGKLSIAYGTRSCSRRENDRLETVGFPNPWCHYAVRCDLIGDAARSGASVGVAGQLALLSEGAAPVLVNNPMDAVAIEQVSRLTVGR